MQIRKNKIYYVGLIVSLLLLSNLIFSLNIVEAEENKKIKAAVSILPQKTFLKKIAGSKVNVDVVIPPGYSPANYAPSPRQMTNFSDADIYFSLGLPAEKANILAKIKSFNQDIKIVRLDKLVAKRFAPRKIVSNIDPHIWLSPKRVRLIVDIMKRELIEFDKKNKDFYQKRAQLYKNKLDTLDKYIKKRLTNLDHKTFIIYHPVLGYFAEDYNLKMVVIEKEGKKAPPKRIQKIIDLALQKNIKVIFYQKTATSRQADIIARELKGKTKMVDPFSPDYIKNMKQITELIKKSLD